MKQQLFKCTVLPSSSYIALIQCSIVSYATDVGQLHLKNFSLITITFAIS